MGKILATIQADPRVSEALKDSDGIWVYLKRGWQVGGCPGEHIIVEDRVADAKRKLGYLVPCNCKECRRG
jgi:hypothetical protein